MTTCPVHAITIVGCPHPNPADTYRDNTRDRVNAYLNHLRDSHPDATVDQAVQWLPEGVRSNLAQQYVRGQFATSNQETS
ncbi:hypothetical protein [Micromonospora sp. NPDC005174]|uniref:hypothetical protein n=1 Tax=Micromonospora sp. NPDC005174 TaxID=3157018 RepID=UPI0033B887B1